jgi:membrane protein DedA with SNARE-associated domain
VEQIHVILNFLVDFVHEFGYLGLFVMAFLESTFVPIPSEVTMVPAGYLVQQGKMDFWIVLIVSTLGCIGGAMANYLIACHYGRRFLVAYGHYMFFKQDKMAKLDHYFANHGEITTLTGRLVPGLRHVISFPAGLARMNFKKFSIYTGIGGGLWMLTLVLVGYLIGDNKELVHAYMPYITGGVVSTVMMLVVFYVLRHRSKTILTKKQVGSDGVA